MKHLRDVSNCISDTVLMCCKSVAMIFCQQVIIMIIDVHVFQGSYGLVKLAYNESDHTHYVSRLHPVAHHTCPLLCQLTL